MTTYQHINTGGKVDMLSDVAGIVNYRAADGRNYPMISIEFHAFYRPCGAVPAEPEPAPEPKRGLYVLDEAQHATVLAALRHWQGNLDSLVREGSNLTDIATNCGKVKMLGEDVVDELCMALNHGGVDMSAVVNILGRGDNDPYVAAAVEHRLVEEGKLEVDPVTIVSESGDGGAYVMAWLWISDELAGVEPDEEGDDD